MTQAVGSDGAIEISAKHIGGIDQTSVSFDPGITVLTGRNATNRTSLLRAIMGGFGSDDVSIKADKDRGTVELTIGDETYTREFVRDESGVHSTGNCPIDDVETAELFAFLLEDNEARRAIELDAALRDIVLQPVDTEELNAEIRSLEATKQQVQEQLDELADLEDQLVSLENQRRQYTDELEAKRDQLSQARADLEEITGGAAVSEDLDDEVDELIGTLHDRQQELERVKSDIEIERESLESLTDELPELRERLSDLDGPDEGDRSEIADTREQLRERRRQHERDLNALQNINQVNQQILSGGMSSLVDDFTDEEDSSITDQLVEGDAITCWTCGTVVDIETIEESVDRLHELAESKRQTHRELGDQIEDLSERLDRYAEVEEERERLADEIESIQAEIEDRSNRIEHLQTREEALETEIDDLQTRIEALETEQNEREIELTQEINRLELECDRIESNLATLNAKYDEIQSQLDERPTLVDRRERIDEELTDLRTYIQRIEEDVVEEFNDHMEAITAKLDFENIERIWLERRELSSSTEGDAQAEFSLNVVRSTEDGTVYEDAIDHLSESERKVTGLIFALTGYLVHEVYETSPILLLDSLEAIDSNRIEILVEYFHEYVPYLVVALLPEDAQGLVDDHETIEHPA